MDRLCIIPCGSAKIWDKNPTIGPTEAQYVYTGLYSKSCREYAQTFFEHWVILSAKYGFLYPTDIITDSYNVTFNKPNTEMITIQQLINQKKERKLDFFGEVTVLGGKHYVKMISQCFGSKHQVTFPLLDCKGMGYMIQRMNNAVKSLTEIDSQIPIDLPKKEVYKKEAGSKQVRASISHSKYEPLSIFLKSQSSSNIRLTNKEIEDILTFSLPKSALVYLAWWANDGKSHSHANSWLDADWQVEKVKLGQYADFKKNKITR